MKRNLILRQLPKIKSMEGAPEKVGGHVNISGMGFNVTEADVRKHIDFGINLQIDNKPKLADNKTERFVDKLQNNISSRKYIHFRFILPE